MTRSIYTPYYELGYSRHLSSTLSAPVYLMYSQKKVISIHQVLLIFIFLACCAYADRGCKKFILGRVLILKMVIKMR